MKTFLAVAALTVFTFANAQKTVELKDFKSLSVGADSKVTLIKSTQNKLVIKGEEENDLDIQNEGGNLSLNGGDNLEITLYYKDGLVSVAAASDGEIHGKDEIRSKEFNITAASDAKVELNLNVEKLRTTAASDAKVTVTGKATNHEIALASDAELIGKDLITENASIVISSDASADITVKGTLNATVGSDGSLNVHGNPKKVNKVEADGAEINMVR